MTLPTIIQHRVNRIRELRKLPQAFGAETDLRTRGSSIILAHDPFERGDRFKNYAEQWQSQNQKGTLIVNPKEDGLELEIIKILKKYNITNYFFLDLTVPTIIKLAVKNRFSKVAVRFY